jgi:twitching motility protein PilI
MSARKLAALRARPFELLVALEEAILGTGPRPGGLREEQWVGVAFRVGPYSFVAPREEVKEVLAWPEVTPLPRAKPWLLGLASIHGQLVAVTDLARWAGTGETALTNTCRLIVVNHPDVPAGLLVDQVFGFRRFANGDSVSAPSDVAPSFASHVQGAFALEGESWTVLGLRHLVESETFLEAAS